jgi:hypothetical protein
MNRKECLWSAYRLQPLLQKKRIDVHPPAAGVQEFLLMGVVMRRGPGAQNRTAPQRMRSGQR